MKQLFYTSLITGILSGVSKDLGFEHTTNALEMTCGITAICCVIIIVIQLFSGE